MKFNTFRGITTVSILIIVIAVVAARRTDSTPAAAPPYMGLSFTSIPPLGVRVDGVRHDSPAADAGLQPGDVIYAIDSHYLDDGNLHQVLHHYQPLDTIELHVKRGTEQHRLALTLQTYPEKGSDQVLLLGQIDANRDGIMMQNVRFDHERGVWQLDTVAADSVLYEAGLRSGDVIVSINDHQITERTRHQLMSVLLYEERATLTVIRGSRVLDFPVPANLAELLLLNVPPSP